MATKIYKGIPVEVNEEGYFVNPSQWTPEMAAEIAREMNINLTEKHYQVLDFLRQRFLQGETLTIRSVGKSGIVDVKEFYQLFPGGPLKNACRIAGIPKPVSCI
jgi:tRNA 2-thiouridine synthesizing protein E